MPSHPSYDTDLVVRAAWMYHADGLTQEQIARRLFVSRQTVGRLLDTAKRTGVVRTYVASQYLGSFELASQLRQRLGLKDAIITPDPGAATNTHEANKRVATALASYSRQFLHPGVTVGVGWGDTVARALSMLPGEILESVTLASATGSIQTITDSEAIGGAVSTRLKIVPAPLIASSESSAEAFRNELAVREVLDLARSASVLITGIGSADPDTASAVRRGLLRADEVRTFGRLGAVGDMLGEWFAIDGNVVEEATTRRRIGLALSELRDIPRVICVAAGSDKARAILGAIRGGYIDVLVTDESTAHSVLDAASEAL